MSAPGTGKRIAFVLPNLGGGGAERVALTVIRHLLAQGHSVDLLLLQRAGELLPLVPGDVQVIDLGVSRIGAALYPLARYLRRARPDALHAMMWPLTVVASAAHALARSSARLTLSDHTTVSQHNRGLSRWSRLGLRASVRLFYPRAAGRIVCSHEAAADLARLSGLPSQLFEAVYNPVDLPSPGPVCDTVDRYWQVKPGRRILAMGQFKPEKNFQLLVRAFAKVCAVQPTAKLAIVGDGPERAAVSLAVQQLGLADKVVLPGFALDPWPWFYSADLFVLSSHTEGFGLVLVEALAAGLPVVSTDCDHGPREILENGRFGQLVTPGDSDALAEAILAALQQPPDPERSRDRARQVSGGALKRWQNILLG